MKEIKEEELAACANTPVSTSYHQMQRRDKQKQQTANGHWRARSAYGLQLTSIKVSSHPEYGLPNLIVNSYEELASIRWC